jgi:hypothetical protein
LPDFAFKSRSALRGKQWVGFEPSYAISEVEVISGIVAIM